MIGTKGSAALHVAAQFEQATGDAGDAAAWLAGLLVGLALAERHPEAVAEVFTAIVSGADSTSGPMPPALRTSIQRQADQIGLAREWNGEGRVQ